MSIEMFALVGTILFLGGIAVLVAVHAITCPYCKHVLTKYKYKVMGREVTRVECKNCGYKRRLR